MKFTDQIQIICFLWLFHGPFINLLEYTDYFSSLIEQEYYPVRKTPFRDAINYWLKRRLWNEWRNPIMMTLHFPDQDTAPDWSCRNGSFLINQSEALHAQVTHHQYTIFAIVVHQTSFCGKTSGGVAWNAGFFLRLE